MASYNIKHIEYLRQKANLTYEQAVALLDRNDGDITKALVELERSGALKNGGAQSTNANFNANFNSSAEAQPQPDGHGKNFWDNAVDLLIKGLRIKLVIDKGSETIARLPILYLIVAVCMAPHLAILSVVLMFLTGCRVHIEHASNPDGDRKIRDYAKGAEQTVRKTMTGNPSDKSRHTPYNAPAGTQPNPSGEKKPDDDFDSFTVE